MLLRSIAYKIEFKLVNFRLSQKFETLFPSFNQQQCITLKDSLQIPKNINNDFDQENQMYDNLRQVPGQVFDIGLIIEKDSNQKQSSKEDLVKDILLVQLRNSKKFLLPKMRLSKLEDLDDLNLLKMKLFNRISLDKWQIYYTSIYPAIIRQELIPYSEKRVQKRNSPQINKKILFFSAKYLSGEILLNPKLVSNYRWKTVTNLYDIITKGKYKE